MVNCDDSCLLAELEPWRHLAWNLYKVGIRLAHEIVSLELYQYDLGGMGKRWETKESSIARTNRFVRPDMVSQAGASQPQLGRAL